MKTKIAVAPIPSNSAGNKDLFLPTLQEHLRRMQTEITSLREIDESDENSESREMCRQASEDLCVCFQEFISDARKKKRFKIDSPAEEVAFIKPTPVPEVAKEDLTIFLERTRTGQPTRYMIVTTISAIRNAFFKADFARGRGQAIAIMEAFMSNAHCNPNK